MRRAEYFVCIFTLILLSALADRLVVTQLYHPEGSLGTHIWPSIGLLSEANPDRFLATWTLASVAVPICWIALHWTSRRLRDAGWTQWLIPVTVLPLINLVLFAALSLAPSKTNADSVTLRRDSIGFGSKVFTVITSSMLGILGTWASTELLHTYGFGLFIVVPVGVGAYSCLVYGAIERRSFGECLGVALTSSLLVTAVLTTFGFEGGICFIMALPLIIPEIIVGVFIGCLLQQAIHSPYPKIVGSFAIPVLLLATIFGEPSLKHEAPIRSVSTAVVVQGSPESVWPHIVAYEQLPPPTELLFRAGLAHPQKVQIQGNGVGAKRVCMLSTGPMPEVVTTWEKARLLKFKVLSTPPSMRELSFWNIDPPHLHGFLQMEQGEIKLEAMSGNRTKLVGTSWYRVRLEPEWYWRLWTDAQIHAIHYRAFQAASSN